MKTRSSAQRVNLGTGLARARVLTGLLLLAACVGDVPADSQADAAVTRSALSTLAFANREWRVRTGSCSPGETAGPGANYWCGDTGDAWVDSQGLHLKMNYKSALSSYAAVELETDVDGCGTYGFSVANGTVVDGLPASLDKSVVFGLFTYSGEEAEKYHEIDVEISDWGQDDPAYNLLYTTWQWDPNFPGDPDYLLPKNDRPTDRNDVPFDTEAIEHSFVWSPSAITFASTQGEAPVTAGSNRTEEDDDIPACPTSQAESAMTARVNLWLYQGEAPASPQPATAQEVIIEDFSFTAYVDLVAPTTLTATAVSDAAIALSWSDLSRGETGYSIERKTGSGSFAVVGSSAASIESFTDTGLQPSTRYDYRLRAVSGGTYGAYSTTASAPTKAPMPKVQNMSYYFGGPAGFVSGELQNLPQTANNYHARTWVLVASTYYPQGSDLAPASSGHFAAQGLWGSNDGREIFVTLHPAATDQYGTAAQATIIEAANWPSTFTSGVIVMGPYATGAAPPALKYRQPVVIRYSGNVQYMRSATSLDVQALNVSTATRWQVVLDSDLSSSSPLAVDDVVRLRTSEVVPRYITQGSGGVATLTTNASLATRFNLLAYNCNCSTGAPVPASARQLRFESITSLKRLKYDNGGANMQFLSGGGTPATWIIDAP